MDSGSSVGPCLQPDISSVDTVDSCLASPLSRNSSCGACIAVSPIQHQIRRQRDDQTRRSANVNTHEFELSVSSKEGFA